MNCETRKCIAVILAKPNKKYQSDILKGIYKHAFEKNFNVGVFYTTLKRGRDKYINCELDIISLINLDKLDGVIYMPDTFEFDNIHALMTEPLKRTAKMKNVPLLTVDYEIGDGVPCLLGSDEQMTMDMIDHLIEVHGCKDIVYMTGKKGHPHAERRLASFREAMRRHGLEVSDDRVYYGDFWCNEGENLVRKFFDDLGDEKNPKKRPQAIACANNYMAESVYKALRKRKIRVPDDVLVTGFCEEWDKMAYISSTVRINEVTGEKAFEIIYDMMNGKTPPHITYTQSASFDNFAVTCGCQSAGDYDYMLGKGLFIEEVGGYISETNTMNEELCDCTDYEDMIWKLDWFTRFLNNPTSFYLCFCENWNKPDLTGSDLAIPKSLTDNLYLYYRRKNKPGGEPISREQDMNHMFSRDDIFPLLHDGSGEPTAYVFRILHFEDHCFGFAVLSYGSEIRTPDDYYDFWLKDLANAMESQRIQNNARSLYKKIEENSVTDLMTGLYNRNGFNIMLPEIISSARSKSLKLLIVLGDMNGLKYINDNFGHIEGDESIKKAAELFSARCPKNSASSYNFRIGGDEYVKVASGSFTEADIETFLNDVWEDFSNHTKSSGKPYPLQISLGTFLREPHNDTPIDEMISQADNRMYENKIKIKKETGFDPKRT